MPKLRILADEAAEGIAKRKKSVLEAEPREGAGVLERRRIETARKPFELAGRSRPTPIETVRNVSGPEQPRGSALDLSALGDWDLAHYEPLERKRPTKVSQRAKTAYTPDNVREFEGYVRKGVKEGGLNWYDMSPLSRLALQEMSPEDFKSLMAMNAATSARSSVDDQIKRASLAWYFKKQGLPWPETNEELAKVADPGYGHLAHDIHSKHLAPLVRGEAPNFSSIDQPKYASYFGNFMGNMAPLTADTHYQALHGFPMKETWNKWNKKWIEAPDFSKDVDYPFAEAFSGERARRMGIPLPLYQSAAWVGGKEATGVRDARPFTAVYDDIVRRTAEQMDLTPTEALKKHLRGELPLLPISKAGGGRVGYSDGGAGYEALKHYISMRLPKKLQREGELRRLQTTNDTDDRYGGSSRDIYALGDNKLVKLAKRPRGLFEQSLEGDPRVSRHLPGLDWRSDNNELAVVERMAHTPAESLDHFKPMANRFSDIYDNGELPGTPMREYHRRDPKLRAMMAERGLQDFLPLDLHGPDFFLAPEHHWSMGSVRPRLLDPGALDYRITHPQFEQQWAGKFRDVLDERLKAILPPKFRAPPGEIIQNAYRTGDIRPLEALGIGRGTEDYLGKGARWPVGDTPETTSDVARAIAKLMPRVPTRSLVGPTFEEELPLGERNFLKPPKLSGGMRVGGLTGDPRRLIRDARAHLAGGGVPRNWLRGVRGSRIDETLAGLKSHVGSGTRHPQTGVPTPAFADNPERIKQDALHKWIDTNLANYLVKQHGTEADPLKAIVGHPPAVEKIPAATIPERIHKTLDQQGWFGYPPEQRGQFDLPPWLKKLAEQDMPRHQSAIEYEKAMKNLAHRTDAMTEPEDVMANEARRVHQYKPDDLAKKLENYQPELARQKKLHDEKYQRRHAAPIELHDIAKGPWDSYWADEFGGTLDYLKQADIKPEDMHRVSVGDAVRKSREWHAMLAKKAEEEREKGLEAGPWLKEHKAYPTGYKWYQYRGEGDHLSDIENGTGHYESVSAYKNALSAALKAEGEHMGHCVGDYCDDVLGGQTQIYSLRDEKGKPHVTVEVDPGETFARAEDGPDREPSIVQIKGKANLKPKDEYLPYVQDFVRSGKWGEVGDLKNTGLKKAGEHYLTPEEAAQFRRYNWSDKGERHDPDERWLSEDDWIKNARADQKWTSKFGSFTDDHLREQLRSRADDYRYDVPQGWKPEPNFAKGGRVESPADFPKESREEALMRAQIALTVLKKEQEQAPEDEHLAREIARMEALIAKLSGGAAAAEKPLPLAAGPALVPSKAVHGGDEDHQLHGDALEILHNFMGADLSKGDMLEQLMGEA